ncbi:hypothetical protein [Clostridium pasteurianum]|uniref:Uncharacterized protein n=1 Tax=Clostridium pasteurianum BC1 TaxID=86416 RepID=R4KE32_CLOPA|nr:hypothetical protein [Clostridium pasteurianum]AGK98809.1 hypothetical protein Clopa_4069 [Clostridium pasteurianum BC1]
MIINTKNKSSKDQEKSNRINELENVVEKYTRTERHLEQHSDIANNDSIDEAKDKQRKRKDKIESLENKIIHGEGGATNEKENLKKNIQYGEGYINHNADNMNESDLQNLKDRQENRKDTLNTLK